MIYNDLRIKTPKAEWIYEKKDKKGQTYYRFLYNYSKKNEKTQQYEIAERYTINVINIKPNADSDIICTRIVATRPCTNFGKDNKTYLVNEVWIEADNVSEAKLSRYQDNVPGMNNDGQTYGGNPNSFPVDNQQPQYQQTHYPNPQKKTKKEQSYDVPEMDYNSVVNEDDLPF
nr:MAG TPA: single-stranded DNA-binding protein [Caudoviricetes sp.]